ncbi:ABC transporter permease [Pontibacter diazotrophicus]|uniref:ABC transporter permease n=1 Tax=Pontibacter diazotrophicus TaxID=1400979 RepID=A0A3D8L8L6_9BACT|nr:ABC transporter permease subunit [Pontibacter diazotrophicus]RDV13750.1 ABC transporter permease [Pontibacter diazotrophicus]
MNLLRIELHKILPYRTVWIILATFAILLTLFLYASSQVSVNGQQLGESMYRLPAFWQRLAYIASFFNLLFSILVIVLITDEYAFRTLRQQVIDGLSRADLVMAKIYVILALAATGTLFLLLLGLYFGLLYSTDRSLSAIFGQIDALFYYFVQSVGYMTLAMLFAFLIKKSGLAIVGFIAYTIIVEPLIHFRLPEAVDKYMPMKVMGSLTPMPLQEVLDQITTPSEVLSPALAALLTLVYIALFWLLSYYVLKLRDL